MNLKLYFVLDDSEVVELFLQVGNLNHSNRSKRWLRRQKIITRRVLNGLRYLSRRDLRGLARGIGEVWKGDAKAFNRHDLSEVLNYFQPTPDRVKPLVTLTDIIVPVYNGVEYLPQLFDTIQRNTTAPYRLIVVDDCSPDSNVRPLLQKAINRNPNGLLLCNERNLGFIGSVNRAVAHAENDFVLLNTDVEVPPGWLERLMAPIINDSTVASATPVTNAGTICSFPVMNLDNDLPVHSTVDQVDAAFRHVNPEKLNVELPTGIGFCMAIRRAVWSQIGGFDPIFGRGYGEENDWCQRAKAVGFRSMLVPNLFVYHKHGGSFDQTEKEKLVQRNLKLLHRRYPNYDRDVRKFIDSDPLVGLRGFLKILVGRSGRAADGVLMIDHQLGGGANAYRRRFVSEQLERARPVLLCAPSIQNHSAYDLDFSSQYGNGYFTFGELDQLVEVASYLSIGDIVVNNLVDWPEPIAALTCLKKIKQETRARLVLPVHDFFPLCPSYNLLNKHGTFCNLPVIADCRQCLPQNRFAHNPEGIDIDEWRERWQQLITESHEVLCFSESSLSLVKRAYNFGSDQGRVRPHDVNLSYPSKPRISFDNGPHIGVVGAINHAKGASIVFEMAKIIERNADGTTLSVIGPFDGWLTGKYVTVTGPYVPGRLPTLLSELRINICFLPSIWPETFSYVTSELIALEMPLCVFDLGAPAERVRTYEKGCVIGKIDAAYALAEIRRFYELLREETFRGTKIG